jgi:hypothetical protein
MSIILLLIIIIIIIIIIILSETMPFIWTLLKANLTFFELFYNFSLIKFLASENEPTSPANHFFTFVIYKSVSINFYHFICLLDRGQSQNYIYNSGHIYQQLES